MVSSCLPGLLSHPPPITQAEAKTLQTQELLVVQPVRQDPHACLHTPSTGGRYCLTTESRESAKDSPRKLTKISIPFGEENIGEKFLRSWAGE